MKWGFFLSFSFLFSLVDRRSMKGGREGGWLAFWRGKRKGRAFQYNRGRGRLVFLFPALAYKRQNCMVSWF